MLPKLHFNADDFGMAEYSNNRLLDCVHCGGLNAVSVLPTGKALPVQLSENIFYCIHLDLVEGKALSDPADIPLLADADGYFRNSFLQLLMRSLSSEREEFALQLRSELRLQMLRVLEMAPEGCRLGVNSHQHTHMIPMIFRTVLDLVKELELPIEYLRIPAEPITPFLMHPSLYLTYRPINIVKNLVLRTLFLFTREDFENCGIESQVFFGIMMSGRMDEKRVRRLLPDFLRIAEKRNMGLEVLFHPGGLPHAEDCMDPRKKGFVDFCLSDGRKEEYMAARAFGQESASLEAVGEFLSRREPSPSINNAKIHVLR